MAYISTGLVAISTGGALGTGPGNRKTIYHYVTNDTVATVTGSGYFNSEATKLKVGDIILVSGDLDGTPDAAVAMVATNDGSTVTTAT